MGEAIERACDRTGRSFAWGGGGSKDGKQASDRASGWFVCLGGRTVGASERASEGAPGYLMNFEGGRGGEGWGGGGGVEASERAHVQMKSPWTDHKSAWASASSVVSVCRDSSSSS